MAYIQSPTFFRIRLLFHFVLSQRAISVFAERPLRGRDGIKEYVLVLLKMESSTVLFLLSFIKAQAVNVRLMERTSLRSMMQ